VLDGVFLCRAVRAKALQSGSAPSAPITKTFHHFIRHALKEAASARLSSRPRDDATLRPRTLHGDRSTVNVTLMEYRGAFLKVPVVGASSAA
jgi:hypothetical protein